MSWLSRSVDKVFGVDRYFFWKVGMKSKLRRARCVLTGGHKHYWLKCRGGGVGWDALTCMRCHCHVAEFRKSQPLETQS